MKEIKGQVQQKKEKENRNSLKSQKQTKRVVLGDDEVFEDPYANENEEESKPACFYCNELFS